MHLIGDSLTVTGYRLAGLKDSKAVAPSDKESVTAAIKQIPGETRILFISHSVAQNIPAEIQHLREHGLIVIELPDLSGGSQDVVNKLVREAVGFDIQPKH
ncbi:V-type ATP synthase subunit F [uncultured archaeon]|nr:V-type ATP synthase subunit F [uncultured archaeon]